MVSDREKRELSCLYDQLSKLNFDRQCFVDINRLTGFATRFVKMFLNTQFDISTRYYYAPTMRTHYVELWLGYFAIQANMSTCVFSQTIRLYTGFGKQSRLRFIALRDFVLLFINAVLQDEIDVSQYATYKTFAEYHTTL